MAKKKGINKIVLVGGATGGIVVVGLIAVLGFGVGLDFVKPFFEPQQDLTVQQVQENNETGISRIGQHLNIRHAVSGESSEFT